LFCVRAILSYKEIILKPKIINLRFEGKAALVSVKEEAVDGFFHLRRQLLNRLVTFGSTDIAVQEFSTSWASLFDYAKSTNSIPTPKSVKSKIKP
jgi:hypothetical protein